MKRILPLLLTLVAGIGFLLAALDSQPANAATRYVCGPCGMPCDTLSYDHPGSCPVCGVALVEASAAEAAKQAQSKVGILIFNGVEIIDYTGPWEVFGAAGYEVYTIAATRDPVTTAMGMTVVPKYTFSDAPQPDVLLIPGGGVRQTLSHQPTLDWIRQVNTGTQLTMSVCNGAFILASTGLLDGLSATTTAGNIERMKTAYPKVRVVNDQRFVDNGKLITTGGLTAGIDGALHVVSRMEGEGQAQEVALGLEYDWRPKTPFTPAAFARRLVPNVDLDQVARFKVMSTQGGTDRWDAVYQATSGLTAAQLLDRIGSEFITKAKWTNVTPASASQKLPTSNWKFTDAAGTPWAATLSVESVAGTTGQYTTRLSITRARKTS
jgi:putative intracellular protease/amidase